MFIEHKTLIVSRFQLPGILIDSSHFPEIVDSVVNWQNNPGGNIPDICFYIIISINIKFMIRCRLPKPCEIEITMVSEIDVCFFIRYGPVLNVDFIIISKSNGNPQIQVAWITFLTINTIIIKNQ